MFLNKCLKIVQILSENFLGNLDYECFPNSRGKTEGNYFKKIICRSLFFDYIYIYIYKVKEGERVLERERERERDSMFSHDFMIIMSCRQHGYP